MERREEIDFYCERARMKRYFGQKITWEVKALELSNEWREAESCRDIKSSTTQEATRGGMFLKFFVAFIVF